MTEKQYEIRCKLNELYRDASDRNDLDGRKKIICVQALLPKCDHEFPNERSAIYLESSTPLFICEICSEMINPDGKEGFTYWIKDQHLGNYSILRLSVNH